MKTKLKDWKYFWECPECTSLYDWKGCEYYPCQKCGTPGDKFIKKPGREEYEMNEKKWYEFWKSKWKIKCIRMKKNEPDTN